MNCEQIGLFVIPIIYVVLMVLLPRGMREVIKKAFLPFTSQLTIINDALGSQTGKIDGFHEKLQTIQTMMEKSTTSDQDKS